MLAGCDTAPGPAASATPSSAGSPVATHQSPQTSSAAPSPTLTGPDALILSGLHRFTIRPARAGQRPLAINKSGRLDVNDATTSGTPFTMTPTQGRYLIRVPEQPGTCLGLSRSAGAPNIIQATACDPGRDEQLFTVQRPTGGDPATYVISVNGTYLQATDANGLIAVELGNSSPITAFVLMDGGPVG
ncbi:hypothetical protein GCM10018962_43040 [Dactylosporangium matsuzakiense]|uniref:Uncharacterized protein n=1 Tax=Dactylosporangium matsuzakiense TaxID=53360 RepID=A0A9W6NKB0_9ACTN|nr:hypothetical protein GCM10017581_016180 [Dactylosporangium matsuzakiense]